jgi:hypothetical protein
MNRTILLTLQPIAGSNLSKRRNLAFLPPGIPPEFRRQ